jgi:hypothetical protein
MSSRIFTFLMILSLGAIPAHASSIQIVDEVVTETHPVVLAIDQDHAGLVQEWLKAGHTPLARIKNKTKESFLERAATHASLRSFEVLLASIHANHQEGLLKDSRGTPILVTLSSLAVPGKSSTPNYEKMIAMILTVSPESAQAKDHAYIGDGRTALHQAAAVGNNDVLQMLITRGALVNAKNSSGETPLHLAARFGHLETVKLLLKWGAVINEKTKYTRATPLMAAAEMGHENIIRMLMISGAEKDARDVFGKTAPERYREYRVASSASVARKTQ